MTLFNKTTTVLTGMLLTLAIPGCSGSAGLQGPAGPPGANGTNGVQGVQGVQGIAGAPGATGIIATYAFTTTDDFTSCTQQFLGPVQTVTTTATQHLTFSLAYQVGTAQGQTTNISFGACYRANGASGSPTPIGQLLAAAVANDVRAYANAGTVVPGSGTWDVGPCGGLGFCATGTEATKVNGYFMVTN